MSRKLAVWNKHIFFDLIPDRPDTRHGVLAWCTMAQAPYGSGAINRFNRRPAGPAAPAKVPLRGTCGIAGIMVAGREEVTNSAFVSQKYEASICACTWQGSQPRSACRGPGVTQSRNDRHDDRPLPCFP